MAFIRPKIFSDGVFIRPGTADQIVYEEVFINREYDVEAVDPHFIIDAGAHIGLSAVYFENRYPDSLIVALEPEDSNFEMLLKNTRRYENIKPLKGGLWSRRCYLKIQNPDAATWGYRVEEAPAGEGIDAFGIDDIMAMFSMDRVDILKMDIEGSEREVLIKSDAWIDRVKILIVELHDRYVPGCNEALDDILKDRGFDKTESGEKVVIHFH